MIFLALAAIALLATFGASLRLPDGLKLLTFALVGATTIGGLLDYSESIHLSNPELAETIHHTLDHVYVKDYLCFIFIPLATVIIASFNLLQVEVDKSTKLGWFLWIGLFIIGNIGTTWAVVPVLLSLSKEIRERYPERWQHILVASAAFSMNMLALMTALADPPQSLYAVKEMAKGINLGFWFPVEQFCIFLMFTGAALYPWVLLRLGVEFGEFSNLFKVRPKSLPKFGLAAAIVGSIAYAILALKEYEITVFLGGVCAACCLLLLRKGRHEERHNTFHWCLETLLIFLSFFSVVALAMIGFSQLPVSNEGMIGVTIGMTLVADNAAAFATAYPQFELLPQIYMFWFALFNSVVYGALSPTGNGPQIALFLVIFVARGDFTPGQVFKVWISETLVFGPYLILWTCASAIAIQEDGTFSIMKMIIIGTIAFFVANEAMDMQSTYRRVNFSKGGFDGRETHGSRPTEDEEDIAAEE